MTAFQVIIIIISGTGVLGSIVGLYVHVKVEIAKIQLQLDNFRHELDAEKLANMRSDTFNREDHKEIIRKIDELINTQFCKK